MQNDPTTTLLSSCALGVALVFAILLPAVAGGGSDTDPEAITARKISWPARASAIWNASSSGEREEGEFLELTDAKSPHFGKKWLVVTNFDVRAASGIYVRLVEKRKVRKGGEELWVTVERRAAQFLRDFQITTSGYIGSTYMSLAGLKFAPGSRVGLEVVQGDGAVWVSAEGYWTSE